MFIEADLHCHSLASTHAYSTVKELAESARDNGLRLFALTDHAPEMEDSPHKWHFVNMQILPRVIKNVTLIKGVEADLKNFDGDIDMPLEILNDMEWVVASCHGSVITPGDAEQNTQAYINMMNKYPQVDLIGHPTSRSYPVDFDRLAKACRDHSRFLELNESSVVCGRSDVMTCIEMLNACKKQGLPVIVDTDCHYCELIGKVPVAESIIKDADFPKELVFNRSAENVIDYLSKKKKICL